MITVTRYHDFSAGHRVVGHENKCRHLHGHNYRVHFECTAPDLDSLGRVVDFGVIKTALCEWLEHNWDHKMLIWHDDPLWDLLVQVSEESIYTVPFNPTAENMADYLLHHIGPAMLNHLGIELVRVTIEETRKCSATVDSRL